MTIQQLEYIVALDTHRHFVSAAESCFVSQPTLTLQIQKLETEMNTTIFDRSKKPIEPTKAGAVVIERAREILREVKGLKDFISQDKDELVGEFRIGVIPTVAPYLLPRFLKQFAEMHPDTNLSIREVESEQIMHDIQHDKLDIGIMATPLDNKMYMEVPLYNEPFLLYVSELNPLYLQKEVNVKQLPKKGLWLLNEGHCLRNQILSVCNQKSKPELNNISYESGSVETLKNMVKSQMGYTLVPELSVLDNAKDARVKRFESPEPVREISLVVHRNFNKNGMLQAMKQSIQQNIPQRFVEGTSKNRIGWL